MSNNNNGIVETRRKSFQVSETIDAHLRVKQDATTGKIEKAGLADNDIGTIDQAAVASTDYCAVNLRSLQGTEYVVAAGAIANNALVYTAANGKVSSTGAATSYLRGRALEKATADGDIIEILPLFTNTAET
jgi:hypothetical protein